MKDKTIGFILGVLCVISAALPWITIDTAKADYTVYSYNDTITIEIFNTRFHPWHLDSLNTAFGEDVSAEILGENTLIYIKQEFYYEHGGEAIGRMFEAYALQYQTLQSRALPPLHPSLPLPELCVRDLATQQIKALYWMNNGLVHVEAMDHFCSGNY